MDYKSPVIVDCHAHLWESTAQLGKSAGSWRLSSHPSAGKSVSSHDLQVAAEPVSVTFLLGFRSQLLGVNIPNKFIADCAYQYRQNVIGFGSVDPATGSVMAEAEKIRLEHKLAGFVISPAGQGFHPSATSAMSLYDYSLAHQMPIIIHNGQPFGCPAGEFSNPLLWSEIFRQYPQVKFVFTDMGWPWVDQTLLLLGEFENVFMDLAGLTSQQWVGYQTLIKGYQMGVLDKFLMGSDYPAAGAATTIEAIYSINQMVSNTNLPTIPRQRLREIVERNTLELLGLAEKVSGFESQVSG
ncbi:MAG: amidohydrolase family protein [Phycisphaerae bacterium]